MFAQYVGPVFNLPKVFLSLLSRVVCEGSVLGIVFWFDSVTSN